MFLELSFARKPQIFSSMPKSKKERKSDENDIHKELRIIADRDENDIHKELRIIADLQGVKELSEAEELSDDHELNKLGSKIWDPGGFQIRLQLSKVTMPRLLLRSSLLVLCK